MNLAAFMQGTVTEATPDILARIRVKEKARAQKAPKAPKARMTDAEKAAKRIERAEAKISVQFARMDKFCAEQPNPYEFRELATPPAGMVAIDLETDDPDLLKKGSSWAFEGVGSIIGVGVAWEGFSSYYPINHDSDNVDRQPVEDWLRELFQRDDVQVLCCNASYDIGWLQRDVSKGDFPTGGIRDVQVMAALLNEHTESFSLDSLSRSQNLSGKERDFLKELQAACGLKPPANGKTHPFVMGNLKRIPGTLLAPYGAADADMTYKLGEIFMKEIAAQDLQRAHKLESDLLPVSIDMRRRGVRVDVDGAHRMAAMLAAEQERLIKKIHAETGIAVSPWDNDSIGKLLKHLNVPVTYTKTNKIQVRKNEIETHLAQFPEAVDILRLRKVAKLEGTFIKGHILGHVTTKGRVHAEFHQTKGERDEHESYGGGTVSFRYSCSNPNLQQLPMRDEEFSQAFRQLILPDTDKEFISSSDYSGQEPRMIAHYAYLAEKAKADTWRHYRRKVSGGIDVYEAYKKNPRLDFHQYTADICEIPRKDAKAINLGLGYGMGGAKLARSLKLPTQFKRVVEYNIDGKNDVEWLPYEGTDENAKREAATLFKIKKDRIEDGLPPPPREEMIVELAGPEAEAILTKWREGAPFIMGLAKLCQAKAEKDGYLLTLSGRHCRFPVNEAGEREGLHKAFNRLIQSSSADQTKQAMLNLWNEDIPPELTIHDELIVSVNCQEEANRIAQVMVDAIKLEIPTVVDAKIGRTLGDIKK